MSATLKLNQLFSRWENSYSPYTNKFKRDGINNEEKYETARKKILFITKEANDPGQSIGDFREWWKEGIYYSFSNRIAEWAYGIFHDFPPYDIAKDIDRKHEALQSIAFMNLKKSGGIGQTDNKNLWKIIENTRDYLLEEIKIISPQIIIGGVSYPQAWNALFGKVNRKPSGYGIDIFNWEGIKIVDFYHPSCRAAGPMSYCLLEKVITSEAFKTL